MASITPRGPAGLTIPEAPGTIKYLSEPQLEALVRAFRGWYEEAKTPGRRRQRGRYWLVFLTLRYTGARLGEVLAVDDRTDLDFREQMIRLPNFKRHNPKKKGQTRWVPVPASLIGEIALYLTEFPEMRGKVFGLQQGNFRRTFAELGRKAGLSRDLCHPHVLRHTRAVELLKRGVPVAAVQEILGHASLTTTAVYLRLSGQDVRTILRDRGLLD